MHICTCHKSIYKRVGICIDLGINVMNGNTLEDYIKFSSSEYYDNFVKNLRENYPVDMKQNPQDAEVEIRGVYDNSRFTYEEFKKLLNFK